LTLIITLQPGHRPKLLLHGLEIHLPNLRLRYEQHPSSHDLCHGSNLPVSWSSCTKILSTCATENALPSSAAIINKATISFPDIRMERLDVKKVRCQAKIVGTVVTVAGAMLMTLYKGPILEMVWTRHVHPHQSNAPATVEPSDKDWFLGSLFIILATLAWASLFVLQVRRVAQ